MPRVIALLVLALALVAAGCGGGDDATPTPPEDAFTAAQVERAFQEEAGRSLEQAAGADEAWEQLGFGLNPSPALQRRYGIFNVYVVEEGNDEAVTSLLSDKATGEPLGRDAEGIYWEHDSLSGTWIAYRRYGENVVLAWFSESDARETDARWSRLDGILSTL